MLYEKSWREHIKVNKFHVCTFKKYDEKAEEEEQAKPRARGKRVFDSAIFFSAFFKFACPHKSKPSMDEL